MKSAENNPPSDPSDLDSYFDSSTQQHVCLRTRNIRSTVQEDAFHAATRRFSLLVVASTRATSVNIAGTQRSAEREKRRKRLRAGGAAGKREEAGECRSELSSSPTYK